MKIRVWICTVVLAGSVFSFGTGPEDGSFGPGQNIADEVRAVAGADLALIPGGLLKDAGSGATSLSDYVQTLSEKIVVLKLTGKQVWNALERSVSMLPSPNPSFLQVSGLTVTYKTNTLVDRLAKVELESGVLNPSATYTVAVPQTMAKGGFGFFTIWDESVVQKTLTTTLGSVAKGKKASSSDSRYKSVKSED